MKKSEKEQGHGFQELKKRLEKKTKASVREALADRSLQVIKAVSVSNALDESINVLLETTKEWYAVHFPELERMTKDQELFLNLISHVGERKNFSLKNIQDYCREKKQAEQIEEKAGKSIGSEIREEDLKRIQELADGILALKKEREKTLKYMEGIMQEELENFTFLATPLIGAKLLSIAGSKKKLSLMPSSTIQLLGAEKALFRHINTGNKPPKYGILYQHPMVMQAKREAKGRIARTLASKLSIAAKMDYFGKEFIGEKLKKELIKRTESLK